MRAGPVLGRTFGSTQRRRIERFLAATGCLLLLIQLVVVTTPGEPDGRPDSVSIEMPDETPEPAVTDPPTPETTPAAEATLETPDEPAEPAEPPEPPTDQPPTRVMDAGRSEDDAPPPRVASPPPPPEDDSAASDPQPPPRDPAHERFAAEFPDQEAAEQDRRRPDTTRWAVLVGINDHDGTTRDNVGSRQDAEGLYEHLLHLGWRTDHIVLLTDRAATRERIEQAIAWLARKTDGDSVAVFHYSGHTKQWPGRDVDGDGEIPDEALWPADNDHMLDGELTHRLGQVRAGRMWINIGACEAAGYADPGMLRDGRVLTFSSQEPEKSYEDPSVSNSVWGYYLIERGMRAGQADADGDGDVTVQEAFEFASPRASQRTAHGSHGPQHPEIQDRAGPFSLRIPPPPEPEEEEEEDEPEERDDDRGEDDEDDGCGLPVCPGARSSSRTGRPVSG